MHDGVPFFVVPSLACVFSASLWKLMDDSPSGETKSRNLRSIGHSELFLMVSNGAGVRFPPFVGGRFGHEYIFFHILVQHYLVVDEYPEKYCAYQNACIVFFIDSRYLSMGAASTRAWCS